MRCVLSFGPKWLQKSHPEPEFLWFLPTVWIRWHLAVSPRPRDGRSRPIYLLFSSMGLDLQSLGLHLQSHAQGRQTQAYLLIVFFDVPDGCWPGCYSMCQMPSDSDGCVRRRWLWLSLYLWLWLWLWLWLVACLLYT